MSVKTLLRHELIGLPIEVVGSTNKSLIGLKGKIIDETKNCIITDKNKKIAKDQVTLKIKFKNQIFKIEGKKLKGRPEERLKK